MRLSEFISEKTLEYPYVRQSTNYSCGATAVQSVLAYYEDDMPRETEVMKWLHTVPVEVMNIGTAIQSIVSFLSERGYTVEHKEYMSIEEVVQYVGQDIPVIVLMQAWAEIRPKDYSMTYDDGHYVVAIGYNVFKRSMYFADPSLETRGWLSYGDLNERWHAIDENGKKVEHYGIAVWGKKPVYSTKVMKRIE